LLNETLNAYIYYTVKIDFIILLTPKINIQLAIIIEIFKNDQLPAIKSYCIFFLFSSSQKKDFIISIINCHESEPKQTTFQPPHESPNPSQQ